MAYDKKYKRRHAARRFGRLRLKRGSAAFPESGGILMYQQEYERWLAAELEDKDLKPELLSIQGIDAEIQDRFAVELEFGTAGLRGVLGAGTNRMNIYMVRKATQGLANYLNKQGGKKSVAISYDSRIKSDVFAREAARVLAGNGVKAYLYKELMPVPALSFATRHLHCDAGIMVTASHNPAIYNGIKVFNGRGYKLSDEMEEQVERLILDHVRLQPAADSTVGRRHHGMHALQSAYIRHLLGSIDCDLTGLRVLVDCANGAASATAPDLFRALPLHADFIHTEPDGVNINNGCGSTHLESLAQGVVSGGYDLGIAFDGDADRCLLVDEKGQTIDGDKVMAVCASELKRQGKLSGNTIVATVMSNLGLHEYCRENGLDLVCTAVGDRHVLEKMLADGFAIGGEQSGHTIFREYATTGDGELTALQFLQTLRRSGVPASRLAARCPQYPQELINVDVPHTPGVKERIMADEGLRQETRRWEEKLNGQGRILIRPSGTEALIRVMVEAKTTEIAHQVASVLADFIKKL